MKNVSLERSRTASGGGACRRGCRTRLGELVGSAREGLLALSVGVGLGVLAELMEEEVDRGRRSEGQARSGARRGAARPRGGGGDARRPAGRRSSGRGCAAPTAAARCRLGPTSTSPTATR